MKRKCSRLCVFSVCYIMTRKRAALRVALCRPVSFALLITKLAYMQHVFCGAELDINSHSDGHSISDTSWF